MTQYASLRRFYEERAGLAYTMEHAELSGPVATAWAARYTALEAEITSLEAAFAASWHVPRADVVSLLPWCSMCASSLRPLLPGRLVCGVCAEIIELGEITPGEHAEAVQGEEDTVGLPYCRMCKRNDRGIWSLEHMLCTICVQLMVP